jgi:protocatechuate 3,4-dioxygenase, alpha subunit
MTIEPLNETPSQTAGPYVHIGTLPSVAGLNVRTQEKLDVAAPANAAGERIFIEGTIRDGAGSLVADAVLELWQADSKGKLPGFWGRAATDFKTGLYRFETVKPGKVAGTPDAPFVTLLIFARGLNIHLHTRMYFADEKDANAADPTLKAVGDPALAATLIGARETAGGKTVYRFDIVLQGGGETVFFDI